MATGTTGHRLSVVRVDKKQRYHLNVEFVNFDAQCRCPILCFVKLLNACAPNIADGMRRVD